jgi:hypothetical protein
MNLPVIAVEATNNHFLKLSFDNNETKIFDASPFLDKGIFTELRDYNYFKQVSVAFGSLEWPHEQDFSYDTYICSASL